MAMGWQRVCAPPFAEMQAHTRTWLTAVVLALRLCLQTLLISLIRRDNLPCSQLALVFTRHLKDLNTPSNASCPHHTVSKCRSTTALHALAAVSGRFLQLHRPLSAGTGLLNCHYTEACD